MSYRMIDHLAKLCGRVRGAALTHRAVICNDIAERYRDRMQPGQEFPDIHQLFTWISEDLERYHQEVVEAETRLMHHLTEEMRERLERDSSVSSLREHLFAARDVFDAIFGPTGNDIIFMRRNSYVFTDPVPLYRQAVRVHDNLLSPDFRLPKLRRDIGVNVKKIAWDMEPDLEVLSGRLEELHLQDAIVSLEAKETRMLTMEVWVGRDVRLLESFAAFADHPGIASRIRRSSHRSSSSRSGGGSEASSESPTPSSGGQPAPETPPPAEPGGEAPDTSEGAQVPPPEAPAPDADEAANTASQATESPEPAEPQPADSGRSD